MLVSYLSAKLWSSLPKKTVTFAKWMRRVRVTVMARVAVRVTVMVMG